MEQDPHRVQTVIQVGALIWMGFWGALAYIAITERSISLGGRGGISHYEGTSAVFTGFFLLGVSILGIVPLIEFNPWKRHIKVMAFISWLAFCIGIWMYL